MIQLLQDIKSTSGKARYAFCAYKGLSVGMTGPVWWIKLIFHSVAVWSYASLFNISETRYSQLMERRIKVLCQSILRIKISNMQRALSHTYTHSRVPTAAQLPEGNLSVSTKLHTSFNLESPLLEVHPISKFLFKDVHCSFNCKNDQKKIYQVGNAAKKERFSTKWQW